jgi:asparagine synthase (glutamine-hydrolysing)
MPGPASWCGRLVPPNGLGALCEGDRLPVVVQDGCFALFRGYLMNRAELAATLGLDIHQSVEAMLLGAYRRWGEGLAHHLDGEHSWLIFDSNQSLALLGHDALGCGPLFWRRRGDELAFSSRLADLVDRQAAVDLNDAYLDNYLTLGATVAAGTPYLGIQRLMPGETLRWRSGSVDLLRYWDPRCLPPLPSPAEDNHVEQFRALVGAAVRGAAEPGRSTWIALSGGLDSNTLLGAALDVGLGDLQAFSFVAPQWPDWDESPWIRAVVERHGLPWTRIHVEEVLPFGRSPTQLPFCGEPDESVIRALLFETVSALVGTHPVLTGKGGDTFMGATLSDVPVQLADELVLGRPFAAWAGVRRWQKESRLIRPFPYWLWRGVLTPALKHRRHRRVLAHDAPMPPWLTCETRRRLERLVRRQRAPAPHCRTPSQQVMLDELWLDSVHAPAMAGHDERHPLQSRQLFEFLWRIPWQQQLQPRCDRFLQRRSLKGVVPEALRRRPSTPTGSRGLVEGLRRSRDWQDYLCDQPLIAAKGLVVEDAWQEAIAQACVGQTHGDRWLVNAITVEVWLRQLATLGRTGS